MRLVATGLVVCEGMTTDDQTRRQAESFGSVAEAYDRARPSYPEDAVRWLTGVEPQAVVELGAGTGLFTEQLVGAGHTVLATDPSAAMLARLRTRVPKAQAVVATAEHIPAASRSADLVACAQSFHWFDHEVALREIARVLRPGGQIALVWNVRDEGVPWVRKLTRLLGSEGADQDLTKPLRETPYFGWVEESTHRMWQNHTRATLLDLIRSRSYVATLGEAEREDLLADVGDLYDDYGRGHDGMLLPYITHCYRATVNHQELEPEPAPAATDSPGAPGNPPPTAPPTDGDDPGTLLIDFR